MGGHESDPFDDEQQTRRQSFGRNEGDAERRHTHSQGRRRCDRVYESKVGCKRGLPVNAINFIVPYRYEGMWVFDDPRVDLDKEPFVSGADDMIDVLVADIANADKGFRLLFSANPFPGHTVK